MSDSYAGIVEQWVRRVVDEYGSRLAARGVDDPGRRKSNAFCALCVAALLELDEGKAVDCLTDGGEDGGVDAIHVGETLHDSFTVWLFQAKYHGSLDGTKAFPAGELSKIIQTVTTIFDPEKPLTGMRDIAHAVEDARSRIRDGAIPQVQVVLCNNGVRWQKDGDARIAQADLDPRQVQWEHVNHRRLVELKVPREINTVLAFEGDAAVEDLSFRRVLVGRLSVRQIAALMHEHGDLLLERNIRRFLGPNNRVNHDMLTTLATPALRPNFYFYNNGVTMVCRGFQHNSLQARNFAVQVKGLQIINGGQTCKTIQRALEARPEDDYSQAHVLVRLYALGEDDQEIVDKITYATNSQTPIELQDLRANDEVQRRLVLDVQAIGYTYVSKRGGARRMEGAIGSAEAAEAIMSVWRQKPHVARTAGMKLFDQYYSQVFTPTLTGAELVAAVLVLRDVETRRRTRAYPAWAEIFMPYASHHLTMMIWMHVLATSATGQTLAHTGFARAIERWQAQAEQTYLAMVDDLAVVLKVWMALSLDQPQVLRDIAGAFRGGRLGAGLALWFAPDGAQRRDSMRGLADPELASWKQRHAGRGHQLPLSGSEPGED
ncbi:AIPR family protein [Nannocystis sp.]|uniref:AIPR family protein n=1 Tax=Nannocystis sp. TaxID=1962667 RepID=UPI0025FFECC3|nr:AIPR family protein [Nannocystis sp.]MBK7825312.1 AIPR family protein [Nannocystis sp.]